MNKQEGLGRENNYDLLRIISTFAVMVIHVNWSFFGLKYDSPEMSLTWTIESLLNIISRFSVPCFVMLSGAFNIQKATGVQFYKKTGWKILIPTLIIGILLLSIQMAINIVTNNGALNGIRITSIIAGGPYDFWYVYMLVPLYLITPLISVIKRNISEKAYCLLALCMGGWALISQVTSTYKLAYSIGVVFAYSGYYILGDVIYGWARKFERKKTVRIVCCIVSAVCIAIAFCFRYKGFNHYTRGVYVNFFSPCIFVYSIMVFLFFSSIHVKCHFSPISNRTFYMYLFHSILLIYLKNIFHGFIKNEVVEIFALTMTIFLISFVLSFVFEKVWVHITNVFQLRKKWEDMRFWRFGEWLSN